MFVIFNLVFFIILQNFFLTRFKIKLFRYLSPWIFFGFSLCFWIRFQHIVTHSYLDRNYSGTSLKWTLTGQKFLSALEGYPPWRGLNWKVPEFKVRLFYTGPTLTRTPPPPYLTMGMWNGEKKVIFFVMYQFILHQRLK